MLRCPSLTHSAAGDPNQLLSTSVGGFSNTLKELLNNENTINDSLTYWSVHARVERTLNAWSLKRLRLITRGCLGLINLLKLDNALLISRTLRQVSLIRTISQSLLLHRVIGWGVNVGKGIIIPRDNLRELGRANIQRFYCRHIMVLMKWLATVISFRCILLCR
jgi:hypothetical protein